MKSKTPTLRPNKDYKAQKSNQEVVFDNIFEAVNVERATFLKAESDLLIGIRDILAANKISNPTDHQLALNRIEQLWEAKPNTKQGDELNNLATIVCQYEEQLLS